MTIRKTKEGTLIREGLSPTAKAALGIPDALTSILAERGSRYGVFKDHAEITQRLKQVILQHAKKQGVLLEFDHTEALEMIAHKIGRIVNGDPNYADSWDDIAGYAKLVGDRLRGNAR